MEANIKKFIGIVVSKSEKTVIVKITKIKTHPIYKKKFKVSRKFAVHDGDNVCNIGDNIEFSQSKPISKTKHFIFNKIISKGIK